MKNPLCLPLILILAIFIIGAGCTESPHISPSSDLTTPPAPNESMAGSAGYVSCHPVTITQTDGTPVTVPCLPQRIIAANSNAAEMMIAIGAQDKIVGVTQSTTNVSYIMEKIPQAENIGDWQIPNIEKILSLHPDVVIAYESAKPKNLDQLAAANITIVYLDCFRLPSLAHDARALGALTGRTDEAEVYARTVEDTISNVTARVKAIPSDRYPTVYSESYTDYTASGPGSGADEQLTLAGGKNLVSNGTASSVKVSNEWVVTGKPDYIFKVISSNNPQSFPSILQDLKSRTGWWDTIPAIQNDRAYLFANDVQYGPRAYIGLVYMARILHPGEFGDMNPGQILDEYAENYVSGTNMTMMVYP
jgi:ABC-type Fe3+-hydroxamate transport system, periplasmic component